MSVKKEQDAERAAAPLLYMRYVGALAILSEASVYVPEEVRESIQMAFQDACKGGRLKCRRVLNRVEIEPV